jgi:Zn-dependent protease
MLAPFLGILYYAMIINLLLAIFNLIPIPPLDGHWILYALLPASAGAALERMGSFGFILLYALMLMGMFKFILIPVGLLVGLLHSI